MTIRRGEDWGTPGMLAVDAPIAASDHELAAVLSHDTISEAGLLAGDLARTVGAHASELELRSTERTRLQIDVGEAEFNGERRLFVAHLIIRRSLWRGPIVAVLNSAFIGNWNVAPRGHPNDGRLDVVRAQLPWSDRLEARRRLPSGTHVPHPQIDMSREIEGEIEPASGTRLWMDGVRVGEVDTVRYRVRPDHSTIVI